MVDGESAAVEALAEPGIVDPSFGETTRIVEALARTRPDHVRFLRRSFAAREPLLMAATERNAEAIMAIVGEENLLDFCDDYHFMCDQFMEEEIFFRRNGCYRLSRFEDALEQVYANAPYMTRYQHFIILTHVAWENHARALWHFEHCFLTGLAPGSQHLEIGPGHGLLLHLAAVSPNVAGVTGWDVSQASIDQAGASLTALGSAGRATLAVRDLFAADDGQRFDSATLSEILEHLEDPVAALRATARRLRPGGRIWVNVPVNSPAPDHIYLFRTPEEVVAAVREAGLEPLDTAFFPMTGQSLERARKMKLTITAVVTAQLPA
jgi:2-polyprenyl-3-methyl-5-hydroxy-6-metoxy-1,4-benzoquinol methylase